MATRCNADEIEQERLAWLHTRNRVHTQQHMEVQRLMLAAAGNEQLAQALLTEPERAVADVAHICRLSDAERLLICAVDGAANIYDFAARLYAQLHANDSPPLRWPADGEAPRSLALLAVGTHS